MKNNSDWQRLQEKREQLATLQREEEALAKKRQQMEREFQQVQPIFNQIQSKKIKKTLRTTGAYVVGRRNRKQLYSKTYKSKQASNQLKSYRHALYNEGFIDRTLTDLQTMYQQTNNTYEKRAIAWELALWYANKQTESAAFQAIPYVQEAIKGVHDVEKVRAMTIIKAECLVAIGENAEAATILQKELHKQAHPDLYLALANTETDLQRKIARINDAYALYDLTSVTLQNMEKQYDALTMITEPPMKDGPKVSVILPAYNAENGIQIAIESILSQSWSNLELLIVDDCSPDNTLQVIQAYAEQDERIKVFSTQENSGPYVARNIALQMATGDFVTVNDADDWSHHDKLRIQAEHLMQHPDVLANTSEQARLTENLQFYRRGNPGNYIFSNMSSFMFRREAVMEKLGFWDTVRFAADGEFVRRFIRQFGEDALVHLASGPLSFPRQSVSSLTSSAAFGYSGFFMGVRKEYVNSFSLYHEETDDLYYPAYQTERLFPVPAPMKPTYEKGERRFDLVMMLDMNNQTTESIALLEKELQQASTINLHVGIVQKTWYNIGKKKKVNFHAKEQHKQLRKIFQHYGAQIIVYGETVHCDLLLIRTPTIMQDWQKFIPKIEPQACLIIIDELPQVGYNTKRTTTYNVRQSMHHIMMQFDKRGRWYPMNESIREQLVTTYAHDIRAIPLATDNWLKNDEFQGNEYTERVRNWIIK